MNLEALTRKSLYQLATGAHINRRSTMNKAQLRAAIEALAEHDPGMYSAVELHYALEFTPQDEAADTATPEPVVTVTLPAALCGIIADTDALEGIRTAPAGARGALRLTATAEQLTALTYDRLWVCAYNSSSEVHERAAYRRWILALEDVGITL